jgi:DNA repair exonuclease SbcCD ATPase subunit
MITLKQIKVVDFRLLRDVELRFPQRGSFLLTGPNEAGKSTLLESIYFALYGEALVVGKRKSSSLNDLVRYGEKQASVTLTVSIGATELHIQREIRRGKGQSVSLRVQKLGMPPEQPITRLEKANERIIAEIGRIDGTTLRNSCLIEQQGLERVEQLSGRAREATLRVLLGLEKLSRLADQFSLTADDEHRLDEATRHLQLAEIQARIPELSAKLGELEAAQDALTIAENLVFIRQQEDEIAELQASLADLDARRVELKGRQGRIAQLKKADATLDQIIRAYDVIADAQRELPELEHQIIELERREREELPALEQRVRELADLTRSFGTLERMATDLLSANNTIKELEQSIKQQEHVQEMLADLDEQIARARQFIEESQQSQHELEELRHSTRPQLETRLKRLEALAEKLVALKDARETYVKHTGQQQPAEENAKRLAAIHEELRENEQELALVENEASQVQDAADILEKRWRELSIRRQLQEWHRLKGLSRGLAEAQQHVQAADAQREQLNTALLASRRSATTRLGIVIVCIALACLGGGGALVEALRQSYIFATIAGMTAIVLGAIAGVNLQAYGKMREQERALDRQLQDANSRVAMMVAAREAAVRVSGQQEELEKVEHEIRSLGGSVPRTVEEGQQLIQQIPAPVESLADMQQKVNERHNEALSARSQVNVTMEAVATLRTEKARLQETRKREGWDDLEAKLRSDRSVLEAIQNECILAAGKEGLPVPLFPDTPSSDAASLPEAELKSKLDETLKSTEYELAALDGKLGVMPDLAAKIRTHMESLDNLQARKQALSERQEHLRTSDPMRQIERAREQQIALRDALRNLQDSLRQRVVPLGVSFGQTAITIAESSARKQLNALQIALGQQESLQRRYASGSEALSESQESLSDLYRRLSKFSNSLGSWIVPLNPFADALRALRERCEREMQAANEAGILSELEQYNVREGASRARIALCQNDIEEAQERIATTLTSRSRPLVKSYTRDDVVAVWPLVGEYAPADRARLEDEIATTGSQLHELEQQDLALSEQLGTGRTALDLDQARKRMAQQERSYSTKERAGLLIAATFDRLMRKMLPRTEYTMQQLLPLLTRGRYHDVRLATEPEAGISSGGPLQVSVWEPAASEYIPLSSLSGSAAAQVSLALRLAFAIAALPRELNAAPGFLLLDEPLSLGSHDRMQSLVEIVTGETLGQHFEQIFFVSHDPNVDTARFTHHVTIDAGQIVETNLPLPEEEEIAPWEPGEDEANGNGGGNGNGNGHMSDGASVMELETVANP